MKYVADMEDGESGVICWIAMRARDVLASTSIEHGKRISRLGRGRSVIIRCDGHTYALCGMEESIAIDDTER